METYTKWLANQKYIAGNEEQKIFNFNQAIQLYSAAIELNAKLPQYYGQRGFARFHQLDFNLGLQDARQATLLDESYKDGYLLTIRCLLALGDDAAASEAINTLTELGVTAEANLAQVELNNLKQLLDDYKLKFDEKDYDGCLSVMAEAIQISPGALNFQLRRAECMLWKKCAAEAMNIAQRVITINSLSAEAHYTLGLIYFHSDMLDKAMKSLECSLQNDQEYKKAKILRVLIKKIQAEKIQANNLFKVGKYEEALEVYWNIMEFDIKDNDEVTAKIWYNCALMNYKLRNFSKAIDNCNAALQRNPNYYKAFWKRAQCHFYSEGYDNCLRDCIEAYNIEMTSEVQNLFNEALKHSNNSLVNDRRADEFIKAGNELYLNELYTKAIKVCSEAIILSPMKIKFYEIRIESAIKSGDYQLALKDLATLTLFENHNEPRKLIKLRCLIFNGDLDEANTLIQDIFKADNQFKDEYVILNELFCTALKVREYYENKNYNKCLDSLTTLCTAFNMKPLSTFYKLIEAECLFNTGLYDQSKDILNEVLRADPSNSKACYLTGLILYAINQLDEAVIQFTKCLEYNSDIVKAQNMLHKTKKIKAKFDLGARLFEAHYYEHANTVYDELLATLGSNDRIIRSSVLHQQAECAFACGEYDNCVENCSQILEMTESKNVQTLLDSAREQWLTTKNTVIKETRIREDEKLKIDEGLRCLNTSNYKKASESFTEAIKINSDNPLSYAYRAECNMHLQLYAAAIADAECSTKIDPNSSKGYFLAAKCCMIIGDIFHTDQKLERIQKLSIVDPVIDTITSDLQALEAAVKSATKFFNNVNYRECLEEIETALEIAHESDHFRLIKAECLAWLGDYNEAKCILKSTKSSNDKEYINGLISYMQSNFVNALRYLDRCIENDPGHKSAKRLLSNLKSFKTRIDRGNELMKMEKFDDALNIFTEAMVVDKKNVVVNSELHLKCAECNYKLGYLKESLNECNSALALIPNCQAATKLQDKCKTDIAKIEEERKIANVAAMHIKNGDDSKNKAYWEEAKSSYTRAIDLKPDNASCYYKRAGCNYKLGSPNECSSDCDNALKLAPDFQEAKTLREKCEIEIAKVEKENKIAKEVEMHIKNGDNSKDNANWNDAIVSYTHAINLKPENAYYYLKRADTYFKFSLKDCLRDCDNALRLIPDFRDAVKLRDQCKNEIAKMENEKEIAKEAEMHIKNGDDSVNEANWEKAIASYTRAINMKPGNASYYAKRAECHFLCGNFVSTLHDARKSTEMDKTFICGYIWETKCLILFGKTENQKKILEKLEQIEIMENINNDHIKEIVELRRLYKLFIAATDSLKKEKYNQSIEQIDSAFQNFPNYITMHYKIMKTECQIRLFQFNEATQSIKQMESTKSHHLLFLKGLLYYLIDDFEKALEAFNIYKHHIKYQKNAELDNLIKNSGRLLVVIKPSSKIDNKKILKTLNKEITKYKYLEDKISKEICMKLYYQRALVNEKLGKNDDAIMDCSNAIKTNPIYVNAIKLRQSLLKLKGDYYGSISDCETLLSIEDDEDTRRDHEQLKKKVTKRQKRSSGCCGPICSIQ